MGQSRCQNGQRRTTKKVFNANPIGTRRKGRPNLRWIDVLEKVLLVLRTKNSRTLKKHPFLSPELLLFVYCYRERRLSTPAHNQSFQLRYRFDREASKIRNFRIKVD
ncbi:hypothetical protein TNCV_3888491 [Trichonephila clavipes]|nr:hypothetical protein TNCV_3888491 [Trichonephila clavipes]